MTSALEGGGGSRKVDKSTDKLRDHVCDKGGRGSKNSKFPWTSLMEAPFAQLRMMPSCRRAAIPSGNRKSNARTTLQRPLTWNVPEVLVPACTSINKLTYDTAMIEL